MYLFKRFGRAVGASLLLVAMVVVLGVSFPVAAPAAETDNCFLSKGETNCALFTPSMGDQTFVVPQGVTSIRMVLNGAGGQRGEKREGRGGPGGQASANMAVKPGQKLTVTVGDHTAYSRGGQGGQGRASRGGNGGGLTAVWSGASFADQPLLLAGGGGGGPGNAGVPEARGGSGGGLEGTPGTHHEASIPRFLYNPGANPGTQTEGGRLHPESVSERYLVKISEDNHGRKYQGGLGYNASTWDIRSGAIHSSYTE